MLHRLIIISVILLILLILWGAYRLYLHHTRLRRRLNLLLDAFDHADTSVRFPEKTDPEINPILNRIAQNLSDLRSQLISNEKFHETILRDISTGVIIAQPTGHILRANPAALRLLDRSVITHLNAIADSWPELTDLLTPLRPGIDATVRNLAVKTTAFTTTLQPALSSPDYILNTPLTTENIIITIDDISSQLEAANVNTWMEMSRILTHEIMNGIAPVISIADTLLTRYAPSEIAPSEITPSETAPSEITPSETAPSEITPSAEESVPSTSSITTDTNDATPSTNPTGEKIPSILHTSPSIPTPHSIQNIIDGLRAISESTRGLSDFVTRYRTLTHIPTPEPTTFPLIPFLRQTIALASQPPTAINLLTDPDTQTLTADRDQLRQVLLNIIKNAIEAHARNITLRLTATPGRTIITIENDGDPIPADIASHIFTPYFTTKTTGSGIGLSISRRLIIANGGTLTLTPAKNTTRFTITLPTLH